MARGRRPVAAVRAAPSGARLALLRAGAGAAELYALPGGALVASVAPRGAPAPLHGIFWPSPKVPALVTAEGLELWACADDGAAGGAALRFLGERRARGVRWFVWSPPERVLQLACGAAGARVVTFYLPLPLEAVDAGAGGAALSEDALAALAARLPLLDLTQPWGSPRAAAPAPAPALAPTQLWALRARARVYAAHHDAGAGRSYRDAAVLAHVIALPGAPPPGGLELSVVDGVLAVHDAPAGVASLFDLGGGGGGGGELRDDAPGALAAGNIVRSALRPQLEAAAGAPRALLYAEAAAAELLAACHAAGAAAPPALAELCTDALEARGRRDLAAPHLAALAPLLDSPPAAARLARAGLADAARAMRRRLRESESARRPSQRIGWPRSGGGRPVPEGRAPDRSWWALGEQDSEARRRTQSGERARVTAARGARARGRGAPPPPPPLSRRRGRAAAGRRGRPRARTCCPRIARAAAASPGRRPASRSARRPRRPRPRGRRGPLR